MTVSNVTLPVIAISRNLLIDRNDRSTIGNEIIFGVTKSSDIVASFDVNYTKMNDNATYDVASNFSIQRRDSLYIVVPITIIYVFIFFTGLIGNVSTCVVISKNRSMHTATNYYLFSLAISDLLLLISGLPSEMYYMWLHFPYPFGDMFCMIQSFAAETSANATVLTITAFTVERYVAICHPFISHTMSKLSRAVKFVIVIWIMALLLAIPQAIQYGIVMLFDLNGTLIPDSDTCSRKPAASDHAFEISTILFFVVPMTIITVLYILIGVKLRRSRLVTGPKRNPIACGINHSDSGRKRISSQRNVIRMLVAVVVAFFICWAPFHAQRLLAVYAQNSQDKPEQDALVVFYTTLTYVSGIFYYLSTTINPLLYNIMSNKFREAFKSMLSDHCGRRRSLPETNPQRPTYSSLMLRSGKSVTRPGIYRNSGSSSASEETHRLTSSLRQKLAGQRANAAVCGLSPPQIDRSTNNRPSLINRKCENDSDKTNDKIIDDTMTQLTTEPSCQMSDTIVSIGPCGILNRPSNNNFEIGIHNCLTKDHGLTSKTVGLGLIAERLRSGTKSLFASQQQWPQNNRCNRNANRQQSHRQLERQREIVKPGVEVADRSIDKFRSHPSLDSANTISNSSLRDLDETEFVGSELANYMGQLNYDLVT